MQELAAELPLAGEDSLVVIENEALSMDSLVVIRHGSSLRLISKASEAINDAFDTNPEKEFSKYAEGGCQLYYVVSEDSEEKITCALRCIIAATSIIIDYVHTDKAHRGRGLARLTTTFVINLAQAHQMNCFVVSTEDAASYWMGLGFVLEDNVRLIKKFNNFSDTYLLRLPSNSVEAWYENSDKVGVVLHQLRSNNTLSATVVHCHECSSASKAFFYDVCVDDDSSNGGGGVSGHGTSSSDGKVIRALPQGRLRQMEVEDEEEEEEEEEEEGGEEQMQRAIEQSLMCTTGETAATSSGDAMEGVRGTEPQEEEEGESGKDESGKDESGEDESSEDESSEESEGDDENLQRAIAQSLLCVTGDPPAVSIVAKSSDGGEGKEDEDESDEDESEALRRAIEESLLCATQPGTQQTAAPPDVEVGSAGDVVAVGEEEDEEDEALRLAIAMSLGPTTADCIQAEEPPVPPTVEAAQGHAMTTENQQLLQQRYMTTSGKQVEQKGEEQKGGSTPKRQKQ
jgi:hypothetical protein